MKRLKFKKEFNGIGNALNLIPESYKVDKKEFEMTDGNESYRIRWEGNLTEGKAIVITAADKKMVNEDIARMKALFNYKSEDTLGLVKGNARIDENKVFGDIWKKTRTLLSETEDEIEGQKPAEGDLDDAVSVAKEAKKHIEGSVPKDKSTEAPKPKEGEWDEAVKPQAKEAKKHIEGSVSKDKAEAPKPKEGDLDDVVSVAKEATKHIETAKGTKLAPTAKVVKEEEEKEEGGEEEEKDNFYKADDEDSSDEKEPTAADIKKEVPPAITPTDDDDAVAIPPVPSKAVGPKCMVSKSTGQHFLLQNGKHLLNDVNGKPLPVPAEYVELAKKNPALALEKIQGEAELAQGEPEGDEVTEYSDEHPISTKDAVEKMKTGK